MKFNAICFDILTSTDADLIMKEFPSLTFTCYSRENPPEDSIIENADILCGYLSNEVTIKARNAKWIYAFMAGVDRVIGDIKKYHPQTIFTNGTGLYGEQISEHLLAMLLGLNRGLKKYINSMNWDSGKWISHPHSCRDIAHSTIGVIGLGDIGCNFARTVNIMGAQVLAYKRRRSEKPDFIEKIYYGDELAEMLPLCDVIAICLPGTEKTRNLIDVEMIEAMKEGVVILNIGRGSIVNTEALIEGLQSGKIGGAGLDVVDPEPLPDDCPLWDMENVIITPHMAGVSNNAAYRIRNIFIKSMKAFLKNEKMSNQVDLNEGY